MQEKLENVIFDNTNFQVFIVQGKFFQSLLLHSLANLEFFQKKNVQELLNRTCVRLRFVSEQCQGLHFMLSEEECVSPNPSTLEGQLGDE